MEQNTVGTESERWNLVSLLVYMIHGYLTTGEEHRSQKFAHPQCHS